MSIAKTFPALLLATCLASVHDAQTTYYVNGTCGSDTWTGLSPVCQAPDGPKATIQAGLSAAVFGDTVTVAGGVYTGAGNKDLGVGNGVTLRSENGPAGCIIDCESLGRGFEFLGGEGPDTVVDGFTITNGRASAGGGIHVYYNSAPSIVNCVITGNTDTGEGGGAIYGIVASPSITNCVIFGNTASSAGVYALPHRATRFSCHPAFTDTRRVSVPSVRVSANTLTSRLVRPP